jgi:sulfite exporter TauE/SafE
MIELPLIFLGGLLGSSHCIGMCGGFAIAIGANTTSPLANLYRQLVFSVGRIFTYVAAGAIGGFAGWRLAKGVPPTVNVQAILALVAGALLVWQGVDSIGIFRRRKITAGQMPCLAASFFAPLLKGNGLGSSFLAGMFTGMLPCGLVYANLALAASTGDLFHGAATMACFGLGTVPLLVAFGAGTSLLSLATRQSVYRLAAWCVVIVGLISIARGVGFLTLPGSTATPHCPFCTT